MTAAAEYRDETSTDVTERLSVAELVAVYQGVEADIRRGFALVNGAIERINAAMSDGRTISLEGRHGTRTGIDFADPTDQLTALRRATWACLIERSQIRKAMSIAAWKKLDEQVEREEPPEITIEIPARLPYPTATFVEVDYPCSGCGSKQVAGGASTRGHDTVTAPAACVGCRAACPSRSPPSRPTTRSRRCDPDVSRRARPGGAPGDGRAAHPRSRRGAGGAVLDLPGEGARPAAWPAEGAVGARSPDRGGRGGARAGVGALMARQLVDLARKAAHPLPPSRDERAAAAVWAELSVRHRARAIHEARRRHLLLGEYLAQRIRDVRSWKRRKESNSDNSDSFSDRSRQPAGRSRIW